MEPELVAAVEAALGNAVVATARVHGGDVAIAFAVDLIDGRRVFVKTHLDPPPGFFSTEAAGLSWLAAADAVDLPEVLAVVEGRPSFLALSWVERGSPVRTTEDDLGRGLAALHASGAPCFGREDRRTTGSRALPNDPTATWAEFYAMRRLLPLARLAADGGALAPVTVDRLVAVAGRLGDIGGPPEPPARLHGDLWAGNRIVDTDGRSWLIDTRAERAIGAHW